MRLEQGANLRGLDIAHTGQKIFNRVKFFNQLSGGLLTNTLYARDVVDGIAHESHDLNNLSGRHPESRETILLSQDLVLYRVVNLNGGREELKHVLVGGDDHRLHPGGDRLQREGTDEIVRLETFTFDHRDGKGIDGSMDIWDLLGQGIGHGTALRLILFELLMPMRRPFFIKDDGEIIRAPLPYHLLQHRDEPVDRARRQSASRGQRRQGEESPVNVAAAVDEIESRTLVHVEHPNTWISSRQAKERQFTLRPVRMYNQLS